MSIKPGSRFEWEEPRLEGLPPVVIGKKTKQDEHAEIDHVKVMIGVLCLCAATWLNGFGF